MRSIAWLSEKGGTGKTTSAVNTAVGLAKLDRRVLLVDADPQSNASLVLTEGRGADVVFECAGGSPKGGLAGHRTLIQAVDAVRSGGKVIGVSWFGGPISLDVDLLRERSLRYVFPDISTYEHLEHTVRLVASGRVRLKPTITHVLQGIESVPEAFEITAHKGKYQAINPAQVMMRP